jgi:secretion/DNA translocation related TadE-like protein
VAEGLGREPDRGSATIWAAALAGLLSACALAAFAFGEAVLARHEAGSAADLAALAAAVHADAHDTADPCVSAADVTRRQRSHIVSCRCAEGICQVRAAVDTLLGSTVVTARAGPADSGEPDPVP